MLAVFKLIAPPILELPPPVCTWELESMLPATVMLLFAFLAFSVTEPPLPALAEFGELTRE
ncbi:MAG: hypothetical protein U7123_06680 [Potamolinea sp.]